MWSSSGVFFSFIFNNVLAVSLRTLKNADCTSYFENCLKLYIFIQEQNCKVKQSLTQRLSLKHQEQQASCCPKFFWLKTTGVSAHQYYNDTWNTINRQPDMYGVCQEQPNNKCLTWDLRCPWATNPAIFETGVREFSFLLAGNILALNQKSQSP